MKTHFSRSRRSWFVLLIVTGLTVIVLGGARFWVSEIEALTGFSLMHLMLASAWAGCGLILTWIGFFLFASQRSKFFRITTTIILLSLPFIVYKTLRPVWGGDLNIARWEPIWSSRTEVGDVNLFEDANVVDLTTETAEDFERFLGAAGTGVVLTPKQIDTRSFEKSKLLWRQSIGEGWSAFVARNGFAVTMEQRGATECVTCYDIQTGKARWVHKQDARHCDPTNYGRVGPRSTPTIHEGKVYALGGVGHFVCLDGQTGQVLWQQHIAKLVGSSVQRDRDSNELPFDYESKSSLAWGRSAAPLIVDDLVVIPGGGARDAQKTTLLAVHKLTGDIVWKAGSEMIGYSTPVLLTVSGMRQIVYVAESQVLGFDPETGVQLWNFPRPGESDSASNCSQPTQISDQRLLISKGYADGGGTVIEVVRRDSTFQVRKIWSDFRVVRTKFTNPVIVDGHSYCLSNGFLECVDVSNGKRIWKHRGRFGHGQILLVNQHLLVHSEDGRLHLVDATPDGYRQHGSFSTVKGTCWNTMCLAGSKILVRSELEAACFDLPIR